MRISLAILLAFACTVARAQFNTPLNHIHRSESAGFDSDWQVIGSFSGLSTNSTFTNQVDFNLYHTVVVANNSPATTNIVWTVDYSLDATNWVIGFTNTSAPSTAIGTNFVQKIGFIRTRTTETNALGSIIYLGGR